MSISKNIKHKLNYFNKNYVKSTKNMYKINK